MPKTRNHPTDCGYCHQDDSRWIADVLFHQVSHRVDVALIGVLYQACENISGSRDANSGRVSMSQLTWKISEEQISATRILDVDYNDIS